MRVAAIVLAAVFTIHDQDAATIQQICDLAALSPALNRDMRAQVSAWCVSWEGRIKDADKPPPSPATPPSDK